MYVKKASDFQRPANWILYCGILAESERKLNGNNQNKAQLHTRAENLRELSSYMQDKAQLHQCAESERETNSDTQNKAQQHSSAESA